MEALQHIWQFTLENVRSFEEETFEDSAWLYSMSFYRFNLFGNIVEIV